MNEDKGARYHRLKRRSEVAGVALEMGLLAGLVFTPAGAALADWAARTARGAGGGAAAGILAGTLFVAALVALFEAAAVAPGVYSGWILERRYGLSTEALRGWLTDRVKGFGIRALLTLGASLGVLLALARSPAFWWLWVAAGFAVAAFVLAYVAPVILMPVFFRFKPLEQDALRRRLLQLAQRAGARVMDVYEWTLGDRTRRANAALVGLHRTRRVLLSDTLLAGYSADEIEVVLAHELAHHVHHDIHKALLFEILAVTAGLAMAAAALALGGAPHGGGTAARLTSLPLIAFVLAGWSLLLSPIAHALSRRHERRADRFALDLTQNPDAFVSAMRRLGAQNLAEEAPSTLVQWFFYTHPPLNDRIAAARAWRRCEITG